MKQFVLTPAAGKRLIAKAVARHPQVQSALESKTVVVVAGTTNGYVAEELLACVGQGGEFRKDRFFRGIILPPHRPQREDGRFPDESGFPGDVVIREGVARGKTIFDVAADLRRGRGAQRRQHSIWRTAGGDSDRPSAGRHRRRDPSRTTGA